MESRRSGDDLQGPAFTRGDDWRHTCSPLLAGVAPDVLGYRGTTDGGCVASPGGCEPGWRVGDFPSRDTQGQATRPGNAIEPGDGRGPASHLGRPSAALS